MVSIGENRNKKVRRENNQKIIIRRRENQNYPFNIIKPFNRNKKKQKYNYTIKIHTQVSSCP